MRSRLLTPLVVAGIAAAIAATPASADDAEDEAIANAALPTLDDLPEGWEEDPADEDTGATGVPECKAIDAVTKSAEKQPNAESPNFVDEDDRTAQVETRTAPRTACSRWASCGRAQPDPAHVQRRSIHGSVCRPDRSGHRRVGDPVPRRLVPQRHRLVGVDRESSGGEAVSDDFAWMDATAQAELVRKGEVTPTELFEAAGARIDKLNPELNAVIHRLDEKAQAAIADGLPDGPFTGVPFLVKDGVCHTAGDPFHCGMQVLKDAGWTEKEDSVLAQRYRAAGFVICGKTNLPELATSVTTEPRAYGATKNPWDTTRSPGGSSGGAAAAVASGMVPVAHGNDMGGSIRFPSGACGLVGLKPNRARTTLAPNLGEYWGPLTHEHVLTRSVRDSARVLDAVHGPAPGDPYTAPPPARSYADEVGADPGRLRIGFRTRGISGGDESHPDCAAAVEAAAKLLESLGHDVEPATVDGLDDPREAAGFPVVYASTIERDRLRWSERLGRTIAPEELEPINQLGCELASGMTSAAYIAALDDLQAWSRGVAQWWADGNDVLVTPTSADPPVPLGELSADAPDQFAAMMRMGALTTFTGPFNVTGQPAISLPLHWNADGLPIGVQLVSAYGREDVLLRLAAQLEAAQPWADRRPPVSA